MNIFQISNFVVIILLILASIQDFLKKSVSDVIHYLLIVFAFSIAIYNVYLQKIPENVILSYLILLFFFLMYLFRYLAVGDLYIMFSLFIFLANLDFIKIFKFLIMLTVGGLFVHCIEAIKIFYKKKEKKKIVTILIAMTLGLISGILYNLSFLSIHYFFSYFIFSSILILISMAVLKLYEEQIRKELTFERTINELVEGDWVENNIKIKKIPENLINEIKENFVLETENEYYVIKLNSDRTDNKLLIFLILLFPFLFYKNLTIFLLISLFIIAILTILHDKIFRSYLGLSKKQIDLLKNIVDKDTKFVVKEGAPFIPAITFAYILSII